MRKTTGWINRPSWSILSAKTTLHSMPVFFPAMLMGQKLPYKLPDEIPANEFYLLEGRQFSKSDGWTI